MRLPSIKTLAKFFQELVVKIFEKHSFIASEICNAENINVGTVNNLVAVVDF